MSCALPGQTCRGTKNSTAPSSCRPSVCPSPICVYVTVLATMTIWSKSFIAIVVSTDCDSSGRYPASSYRKRSA